MKTAVALFFIGTVLLHPARQAASDLEVQEIGRTQFVSYDDLLRLPQVQFKVSGDSNFPAPALIGGVALDH